MRIYDFAAAHPADAARGLERTLLVRRSAVPNKKNSEPVREVACSLCYRTSGTALAELVIATGRR